MFHDDTKYLKHLAKIREDIKKCPFGNKKWWPLNAVLLSRRSQTCAVPALEESDEWLLDPEDKENMFAVTWAQN